MEEREGVQTLKTKMENQMNEKKKGEKERDERKGGERKGGEMIKVEEEMSGERERSGMINRG